MSVLLESVHLWKRATCPSTESSIASPGLRSSSGTPAVSPYEVRLRVLRSQPPSFGRRQAMETKPEQSGRYFSPVTDAFASAWSWL